MHALHCITTSTSSVQYFNSNWESHNTAMLDLDGTTALEGSLILVCAQTKRIPKSDWLLHAQLLCWVEAGIAGGLSSKEVTGNLGLAALIHHKGTCCHSCHSQAGEIHRTHGLWSHCIGAALGAGAAGGSVGYETGSSGHGGSSGSCCNSGSLCCLAILETYLGEVRSITSKLSPSMLRKAKYVQKGQLPVITQLNHLPSPRFRLYGRVLLVGVSDTQWSWVRKMRNVSTWTSHLRDW